jgi:hypothetical protein
MTEKQAIELDQATAAFIQDTYEKLKPGAAFENLDEFLKEAIREYPLFKKAEGVGFNPLELSSETLAWLRWTFTTMESHSGPAFKLLFKDVNEYLRYYLRKPLEEAGFFEKVTERDIQALNRATMKARGHRFE